MLLYSLIGMFKKTTSKDSKIKDIVKFLKLLPESQIDQVTEALLYGRISAVANTRLVEDSTQTTKIISNDEAPLETPTKKATKADWVNVRQHLDNKIYFKGNKSGNLNAEKGDIDTVIETIESMPVLPKCVKISTAKTGNRKGLKTLFVNINSKYGGIPTNQKHAIDLLAKLKFEAVMP